MSNKIKIAPNSNKENVIILGIIGSITIIIVAAIWFLGGSATSSNNQTAANGGARSGNNEPAASIETMVGKASPSFSFKNREGKEYNSDNLKGKNVILFFSEGLMCYPACWDQMAELGSDQRLNNNDTISFSVVMDSPTQWQGAVQKMPALAKANTVFDSGGEVSRRFGMLTLASSMHYGSLPGHTYVVIDKQGIVRHVFDDPNMAIHNNQLVDELAKLPN